MKNKDMFYNDFFSLFLSFSLSVAVSTLWICFSFSVSFILLSSLSSLHPLSLSLSLFLSLSLSLSPSLLSGPHLSPRCDVRAPVWDSVCVQCGGIPCQPPAHHQPQLRLDRPSGRHRLRQLPCLRGCGR